MTATPNEKALAANSSATGRKSLAERLETHPELFLAVFTVAYVVGMSAKNARRGFWVDELFTYSLANLPSIGQIWTQLAKGIELNPPLPFWLTWLVHHTLGQGEVLTRLPALVGFWVACVCLFLFVRRRSDALHGFVALLLPVFTFTSSDATWARGYGLLLGFSAAALLCWQLAADRVNRPFALAGLALSIAGAVSCHFYAAYVVGTLGLGELVRIYVRRKVDWSMFAALLTGLIPLAAYAPMIGNARRGLSTFWVPPMASFLYESYADLLGPIAIVFFLLLIWIVFHPKTVKWMPSTLEVHEVVACSMILAMPLVFFGGAVLGLIAFYSRYVQPVVIGFSALASLALYRIGGGNPKFRTVVAALLVWCCLGPWCLWQVFKLSVPPPDAEVLKTVNLNVATELPLLIDSPQDFMAVYHYASPNVRKRLYYLDNPQAAVKYWGSDTLIHSFEVGQTFIDLHVVDYHKFVEDHREFLVVRVSPSSWMIQALLADGAKVELVDYQKARSSFAPEALTFRIKIPVSPRADPAS